MTPKAEGPELQGQSDAGAAIAAAEPSENEQEKAPPVQTLASASMPTGYNQPTIEAHVSYISLYHQLLYVSSSYVTYIVYYFSTKAFCKGFGGLRK
jgi:hypothetical protein